MIQVIGMISADKGIESFICIWVVVLDDEIMSITVLGEDFVITKSGVHICSQSDIIVKYFSGRSCLVLFVSFPALYLFE